MSTGNTKAFTLIEFLVALVIIGFIVAILVGVFASPVRQARIDSEAQKIVDNIRSIREAYDRLVLSGAAVDGGAPGVNIKDAIMNAGLLAAWPKAPAGVPLDYTIYGYNEAGNDFGGANSYQTGNPADRSLSVAMFLTQFDSSQNDLCAAINKISGAKAQGAPTCQCLEDGSMPCDGPAYAGGAIQCCIGVGFGYTMVFGSLQLDGE